MGNAKLTAKVDGNPTVVVDLKATPEGYLILDTSNTSSVESVSVGSGLEVDNTDPKNPIISRDSLNPPVIARYRARFTEGGSQTIPTATITSLVFGDELEDTANISSDGTIFTAPSGTTSAEVIAQAAWQSNGNSALRQMFLQQNGVVPDLRPSSRITNASTSIDERTHFSSAMIPASAGDTFEIAVQQTSGAGVDVVDDNNLTWVQLVFYGS